MARPHSPAWPDPTHPPDPTHLVISDRLKRLARAYGPNEIHLSPGPGNSDLFTAIRGLVL